MRLARAGAGHVPAHARPPRSLHQPTSEPRRSRDTTTRSRRWTPLIVIAVIYLVAVVINEWRLRQHVQELRDRAPAAELIVDADALEPVAAAD